MKKTRGELVQIVIGLMRDKMAVIYQDWLTNTSTTLTPWEESWQYLQYESINDEINQLWTEEYNE